MSDRQVQQLKPELEANEFRAIRLFSSYEANPNIVLLGDPGAGKTYLFREAARATGGRFVTTRDFLNIPKFPPGTTLFIDALDEKRGGRGDGTTIDEMVRKLFEVRPEKVRISCRAPDWLGETDLAAFRAYFDDYGGVTVLALNVLSADEQESVLVAKGVANPKVFITEAVERDLTDFLGNPQNLIQLVDVVQKSGRWPTSRRELFDLSSRFLLSEPNGEKARIGLGVFSEAELRPVAGAVCAVRLVSDVAGISLTDNSVSVELPSYRSLPFGRSDLVLAALGRRVFESDAETESVDYAHRTTAEFLAAGWLAEQVRAGLPLGRVRALLGVDGHPAAELRGLHAWLPVFLPEYARELVNADPYGTLTYGDSGSLSPEALRGLLVALGELSKIDPWFRSGDWSSRSLGAICRTDMIGEFQTILRSSLSGFGVRWIVIDALAVGTPLPAMSDDLLVIAWSNALTVHERDSAVAALLRFGPTARSALAKSYRGHEHEEDSNTLSVQTAVVSGLYGEPFGVADVAALVKRVLNSTHEVPTGTLWRLPDRIPLADVPSLLDQVPPVDTPNGSSRRNLWEVAAFYDRLLTRLLTSASEFELVAARVLAWLETHRSFRDHYSGDRGKELLEQLKKKPILLENMGRAFFDSLDVSANRWLTFHQFREATFYLVSAGQLLEIVLPKLRVEKQGSETQAHLYDIAFSLCYQAAPDTDAIFDVLFTFADDQPQLLNQREKLTRCELHEMLLENKQKRVERAAEEKKGREDTVARYLKRLDEVRAGADLNWLTWCARLYFGFFRDVDEKRDGLKRLVEVVGAEGAAAAVEGFVAVLRREDIPTLAVVAETGASNRHSPWWFVIIAGLDERWKQTPDLGDLSPDLLRVAIAIDDCCPTFDAETNRRLEHGWKDEIMARKAALACDAYTALVRAGLKLGTPHVPGLHELLNDGAFEVFRSKLVFELLRDFPDAGGFQLGELLAKALSIRAKRDELVKLATAVLNRVPRIDEEKYDMWLAAAYAAAPDQFEPQLLTRIRARPNVIWNVRDLGNPDELGPVQLELLVREFGSAFPDAGHPNEGWSGDTNPWDAAEFIKRLVNKISSNPTEAATTALACLDADAALGSYRDFIKHALAQQRTARREAEYRQPDWDQTVAALSNGAPASVPDLHALLVAQLDDIAKRIASGNTDIYKQFWNEDSYGHPTKPKPEESCRDVLVDLLRVALSPLGILVEPEGHMASDERADISVALPGRKILVELKRDYHAKVWTAATGQLEQYTRDPESTGFGVYGVFWFGADRGATMPAPTGGRARPVTAAEMQNMLFEDLAVDRRERIAIKVIDVSGKR